MNYYKILEKNKIHNGLTFKEGLNIDPISFNPSGICLPGGIYFAKKDILAFIWQKGSWVCKVTLPKNAHIYKDPVPPEKWKTDRIILGPAKKITLTIIKKLIYEGANIHAGYDIFLHHSVLNNHFKIVKCIIKHGVNQSVKNCALLWANGCKHLKIAKYLIEQGAKNDHVLKGPLDISKHLKKLI